MAEDRHLTEQVIPALFGQGLPFLGAPVEMLSVAPNDHRGIPWHDTQVIPVSHLDVKLREEGQIDAGQGGNSSGHRPGSVDDHLGGNLVAAGERNRPDRSCRHVDAGHPVDQELQPSFLALVQHPGPELLGTEPACSPHMDRTNDLRSQVGEVIDYLIGPDQDVGAFRSPYETLRWRGTVWERPGVETHRAGTEGRGVMGILDHPVKVLLVSGDEEIATAVQGEAVARLGRHLLQQVDRSAHQPHHGEVWPPVAVALGRLVRGERHGWARIDDHDIPDPLLDRELVGRGDAGDPSAYYDDVGPPAHLTSRDGPVPGRRWPDR